MRWKRKERNLLESDCGNYWITRVNVAGGKKYPAWVTGRWMAWSYAPIGVADTAEGAKELCEKHKQKKSE